MHRQWEQLRRVFVQNKWFFYYFEQQFSSKSPHFPSSSFSACNPNPHFVFLPCSNLTFPLFQYSLSMPYLSGNSTLNMGFFLLCFSFSFPIPLLFALWCIHRGRPSCWDLKAMPKMYTQIHPSFFNENVHFRLLSHFFRFSCTTPYETISVLKF